jgi:hypothetical protein
MVVWGRRTDTRTFTDGAAFTPAAGSWGRVIQVPGLEALNKGDAVVVSVSCASAGSCAAGGSYDDRFHHGQGSSSPRPDSTPRAPRAARSLPDRPARQRPGSSKARPALVLASAGNRGQPVRPPSSPRPASPQHRQK